jgi:hypothetical protein
MGEGHAAMTLGLVFFFIGLGFILGIAVTCSLFRFLERMP